MSDYTPTNQGLSDLNKVAHQTKSFIVRSSSHDRRIIFTNWIDMLLEMGRASSISQASKIIALRLNQGDEKSSLTHQAIASYYKGGANA